MKLSILCAAAVLVFALAFATPARPCELLKVGTIAVEWDQNRVLTPIVINEEHARAMIDTGASNSVLFMNGAQRLNLATRQMSGVAFGGFGGTTIPHRAHIRTLQVGTMRDSNLRIGVLPAVSDRRADVVMLLGLDVLARQDIELNLAGGEINFFETGRDCRNRPLAYWGGTWSSTEMLPGGDPSAMILSAKLNGAPIRVLLDSGATISVVSNEQARRLGVTPESEGSRESGSATGISGHSVPQFVGRFAQFDIGEESIRNIVLRVSDLRIPGTALDGIDMILGADFLRTHRVFVSYRQREVYFSYLGGPVFQILGPILQAGLGDVNASAEHDAMARCSDSTDRLDPPSRIAGCTALIESGALGPAEVNALRLNRARHYLSAGAFESAVQDLDIVLTAMPDNVAVLNERCWARALGGIQLDEALNDCTRALQLAPRRADVLDSRGLVHLRRGDNQAAFADYDAAVAANRMQASPLFGRGLAAIRLGRREDGRADLRRAERLDPDIAEAYASIGLAPD